MTKYRVEFDSDYSDSPARDVEAEGYNTDSNWVAFSKGGKPVAMFSSRAVVSVLTKP